MTTQQYDHDIVVIFENAEWQQPLFDVLDARGVNYGRIDLKSGAFPTSGGIPRAKVYFNQASPSAYVRGRDRVVPFNRALLRALQIRGAHVLNGADVFDFELSKSAQAALLDALGIDHPHTIVFNDVEALEGRTDLRFPAMLKPEQGGSGARMHKVESLQELRALLEASPELWEPDKLLLLQEYCLHDPEVGVVRLEFVGGKLLYGMRVVTHGQYNLCPSETCNPVDGVPGACAYIPGQRKSAHPPVEFYPFPDIPDEAVKAAQRIVAAARMDVAGIEYLETPDGRRVFYDINANSNLRRPIGQAFGFDPFERVADYLQKEAAVVDGKSATLAAKDAESFVVAAVTAAVEAAVEAESRSQTKTLGSDEPVPIATQAN
eukprot:INCI5539.1.p1 GENE.INCI5539.1~~INCI5539.1.p1  ORF type:complete len:377 (-),score=64.34 INCI5539.1:89-1219(-)